MAASWRMAAALAAFAGYALLSHGLMLYAADRPWAVAVLFGPLVLAVAGAGWQQRQPLALAACAAGVALLVWVVARGGVTDINRLYVLQYAGMYAALIWVFGSSLRPGATPLITAMAATLHSHFPPALQAYTRWLTGLWTAYFAVMVAMSFATYALAPWAWWSLYANLLTPLSAGLLFAGEYLQRYRRHPDFERVSLSAAIAAYRGTGDTASTGGAAGAGGIGAGPRP